MNSETQTAADLDQLRKTVLKEDHLYHAERTCEEESPNLAPVLENKGEIITKIEETQQTRIKGSLSQTIMASIKGVKRTLKLSIDLIDDVNIMLTEIESERDDEKTKTIFTRLKDLLIILKGQLNFIAEFFEISTQHSASPESVEKLASKYSFLKLYAIPAKSIDDVSFITLESTLNFLLHSRLANLLVAVYNLYQTKNEKIKNLDDIATLQIVTAKIASIVDYIPHAVCYSKEDIFAHEKSGSRWTNLHGLVKYKVSLQLY